MDEAAERKRKAEDGRKNALLTCRQVPREKPYSNMTIASLGLSPRTRGSLTNFAQQRIMSIPEQPVYPAFSPVPSPERSPKGKVIRNKHGTATTIPRLQLGSLRMMEGIPRVPEPLPTTRRHYQPSPQLSPHPSLKPVPKPDKRAQPSPQLSPQPSLKPAPQPAKRMAQPSPQPSLKLVPQPDNRIAAEKRALSPRRCPGRENANTRFLRSVPQTALLPWDLSPSRAAFRRSPKRTTFKPVHRKLERSRSLEPAVSREKARRPQTHPLCHVSPPAPAPRRKMIPPASKQEAKKKRWFSRLIK